MLNKYFSIIIKHSLYEKQRNFLSQQPERTLRRQNWNYKVRFRQREVVVVGEGWAWYSNESTCLPADSSPLKDILYLPISILFQFSSFLCLIPCWTLGGFFQRTRALTCQSFNHLYDSLTISLLCLNIFPLGKILPWVEWLKWVKIF